MYVSLPRIVAMVEKEIFQELPDLVYQIAALELVAKELLLLCERIEKNVSDAELTTARRMLSGMTYQDLTRAKFEHLYCGRFGDNELDLSGNSIPPVKERLWDVVVPNESTTVVAGYSVANGPIKCLDDDSRKTIAEAIGHCDCDVEIKVVEHLERKAFPDDA